MFAEHLISIDMQITINEYLTWERAVLPDSVTEHVCPMPITMQESRPNWFRHLPGNLKLAELPYQSSADLSMLNSHGWRSVKFCEGIKGVRKLGYTIPLQAPVDNARHMDTRSNGWAEAYLHPEMLHGTCWAENDGAGNYAWTFKIMGFPWRARLSKGWRLAVQAYPLDWSREWFCFSGSVDSCYQISPDGCDIGSFWHWEEPVDPNYNYFNVETVVALDAKKPPFTEIIPAGTFLFSLIPVYDPSYMPLEFKGYPNF